MQEPSDCPGAGGRAPLDPPVDPAGTMLPHEMPTLHGAPVGGLALSAAFDLPTGDSAARYTNATEYGRGGMGRVLLVHDTILSRDVALKELIPAVNSEGVTVVGGETPAESSHLLQRFLREARITGNLEHPSIVPVYELGRRSDGAHYYTMKLVRGRTLHRAIQDAGNLEERLKLLPHVIDLCHAIAYAHSKNVIHRDIKPANIMVGSYGETVVIDWGLARVIGGEDPYAADLAEVGASDDAADEDASARTLAGIPVGTPHYMSPEQAAGRLDDVGAHSDVYALGVVLYELLTGTTPFPGPRTRDVLNQVLHARPKRVTLHEPDIPPALAGICAKAMERRPEDRYRTAAELAEELGRFTTGALVRSYDYNFWELARHYYKQHRALCNTVLTSAVVVVAVVVVAYASILDANRRERVQRLAAEEEAYRANIQVAANDVKGERFQKARERLLLQPAALRDWEWGLLFAACHQDRATATEHTTPVHQLIGAPETGRVITAGMQGELFVWSTPDLGLLHRFDLPTLPSIGLTLSPDEKWLAVSRMDGLADLYDFSDFTKRRSFRMEGTSLNSAAISGDGRRFAAGGNDGTLIVWNTEDGAEIRRIDGTGAQRYAIEMGPDGRTLLGAGADGRSVLWDIEQGVPLREVSGSHPVLLGGGRAFAVHGGGRLEVFSMDTGALRFQTAADPDLSHVLGSGDGKRLALVTGNTVQVLELPGGQLTGSFESDPVWRALAMNKDGTRIAIATLPHSVQIRDVETGDILSTLRGHSDHVEGGFFGADGKTYYTCARDKEVKAWELPAAAKTSPEDPHDRVIDLAWSETAGLVAAATLNGTVHFLDKSDLTPRLSVASFEPAAAAHTAFHSSGERALVVLSESSVFELALPEGNIIGDFASFSGRVMEMAYGPDGGSVAIAYGNDIVQRPSLQQASGSVTFEGHQAPVAGFGFLPDGRRVVSADRSGSVYVWDRHTGVSTKSYHLDGEEISAIAVSPVSAIVACALTDRTIRLIALDSDSPARSLLGHNDRVCDLAFSSNGTRLFSLSDRGEVKIWSTASGEELLALGGGRSIQSSLVLLNAQVLVSGENRMITSLPAFPGTPYAYTAVTPDAVGAYKAGRVIPGHQTAIVVQPGEVIALMPLEGIATDLERVADSSLAPDGRHDGTQSAPTSNPLTQFGVRPGDEITTVNGQPYAGLGQLREAVNTRSLALGIRRAGDDITIQYRDIPIHRTVREMTLPRDTAMALLQGLESRMQSLETVILEYSQRRSRERGVVLQESRALDGLWILPPASAEDTEVLASFELIAGDSVTAVNGTPILDYGTILEDVANARTALEQGWTGSLDVDVRRGRFHQMTLRLAVH